VTLRPGFDRLVGTLSENPLTRLPRPYPLLNSAISCQMGPESAIRDGGMRQS